MKSRIAYIFALIVAISCSRGPSDGIHTLCVLSTNDIHGAYFDTTYAGGETRTSLISAKVVVDSIRAAYGKDNVLLIDVGDNLQGDNAAYFFNYVDTLSPHVYPRMAAALGYDAVVLGNHDIETGHPVYDRIVEQFRKFRIPYLAGNAFKEDGTRYFNHCALFKKAGMRILLLGYDNAAISTWLDQALWSGMHFESLIPLAQNDINELSARFNPDVVIVAAHTGTGTGDGQVLENQGLDLLKSLEGVDIVLNAHDHKPFCDSTASSVLVNSGNKCRFLGQAVVTAEATGSKIVSKSHSASLIPVDKERSDAQMQECFREDFLKVREFTLRKVGSLSEEIHTRDAFKGMCSYMNLIHTICLKTTGADMCFAAPLTYNGTIPSGGLDFDDMFLIYPFENQLYTIKMTGLEIKDYLEYSYGNWINTMPAEHLLKIRYGKKYDGSAMGWSFENKTYNLDSAGGINYTVDVRRPVGERVKISSFANGNAFDPNAEYVVAITSYRASGGGKLVTEGAGIKYPEERIVKKYRDIRGLVFNYVQEKQILETEAFSRPELIGEWHFEPEVIAGPAIDKDFSLLF